MAVLKRNLSARKSHTQVGSIESMSDRKMSVRRPTQFIPEGRRYTICDVCHNEVRVVNAPFTDRERGVAIKAPVTSTHTPAGEGMRSMSRDTPCSGSFVPSPDYKVK